MWCLSSKISVCMERGAVSGGGGSDFLLSSKRKLMPENDRLITTRALSGHSSKSQ